MRTMIKLNHCRFTGILACVFCFSVATSISPLELIRTKMQSKKLSYLDVHQEILSLVKYQGYKGLDSTPLRYHFYWYSLSYVWICLKILDQPLLFMYKFLVWSIDVSLTMPFDVINTFIKLNLSKKKLLQNFLEKLPNGIQSNYWHT